MVKFIETLGDPIKLSSEKDSIERVHKFDQRSVDAINAAIGSGRPLLVRGEPGVGKSQLAEAAAKKLERAFVSKVVDSRTESRDLMYEFDAVARLGEAQLRLDEKPEAMRARLAMKQIGQRSSLQRLCFHKQLRRSSTAKTRSWRRTAGLY